MPLIGSRYGFTSAANLWGIAKKSLEAIAKVTTTDAESFRLPTGCGNFYSSSGIIPGTQYRFLPLSRGRLLPRLVDKLPDKIYDLGRSGQHFLPELFPLLPGLESRVELHYFFRLRDKLFVPR